MTIQHQPATFGAWAAMAKRTRSHTWTPAGGNTTPKEMGVVMRLGVLPENVKEKSFQDKTSGIDIKLYATEDESELLKKGQETWGWGGKGNYTQRDTLLQKLLAYFNPETMKFSDDLFKNIQRELTGAK